MKDIKNYQIFLRIQSGLRYYFSSIKITDNILFYYSRTNYRGTSTALHRNTHTMNKIRDASTGLHRNTHTN